ncbi:MAG: CoA pyrophosphatase [Tatlockia sp.]|jgi:8-oxo-dGTP pyrophosphatase MutT (NUDIX family)
MNQQKNVTRAAVVVLQELATDSLILTQRSLELPHHPGEVCFPGGRFEKGDSNLAETALRELQEELGILPARVRLMHEMATERTLQGVVIHPWFATIEQLSPFDADSREVAQVFAVPMADVTNALNYQKKVIERFGLSIKTWEFIKSPYVIWGATARIMRQLCE